MYLPMPPEEEGTAEEAGKGAAECTAAVHPPPVLPDGKAVLVRRVAELEGELQRAAKKVAVAHSLTARVGDLSSTIDNLQVGRGGGGLRR